MSYGQRYRPAIDQIKATLNLQVIGSLGGGVTREMKPSCPQCVVPLWLSKIGAGRIAM